MKKISVIAELGIIVLSILIFIHYVWKQIDSGADLGLYHFLNHEMSPTIIFSFAIPFSILIIWLILLINLFRVCSVVGVRLYSRGHDISFLALITAVLVEIAFILIFIKAIGYNLWVDKYQDECRVEAARSFAKSEKTVIHAGGAYQVNDSLLSYTNSKEALINSYNLGNHIVEMDFIETGDNKLVCGHDEGSTWCFGIDSKKQLTEEEFLSSKLFGSLTTINVSQLADIMRENTDLFIVTDIKDDNVEGCRYIAENYPDLVDRFIVQIYHMDEYEPIKELGFDYMIYTLYATEAYERDKDRLISDINSHDLIGVTFWYDWLETKDVYDNIKDIGVPIFVHTVNDKDEIENCNSKGILIYTDNTENEWLR